MGVGHLRILGLSASEAQGLFTLIDIEETHQVSIDELVLGMMRMKSGSKGLDLATLMYENKKIMVKLTAFMNFMEDFALGEHDGQSMEGYIGDAEMDVIGKRTNTAYNKSNSSEKSLSQKDSTQKSKTQELVSQKSTTQELHSQKSSSQQFYCQKSSSQKSSSKK